MDVNSSCYNDWTPLICASRHGKLDAVKFLVEHKAAVTEIDAGGWSALHHACAGGFDEIAAFLLDKGADFDKRNGDSDTPLILAVLANRESCVKLLLERKADATAQRRNGQAALDIAQQRQLDKITSLLQFAATAAPPPAPIAPRIEPATGDKGDSEAQAANGASSSESSSSIADEDKQVRFLSRGYLIPRTRGRSVA